MGRVGLVGYEINFNRYFSATRRLVRLRRSKRTFVASKAKSSDASRGNRERGGLNERRRLTVSADERHTDEFAHPSEFQKYRKGIGGLLLLFQEPQRELRRPVV